MPTLIVLDLNGAILDAAKKLVRDSTGRPVPPVAKTATKYIYLRPGAIEFLEWLMERFDVGVWTSCVERNAHAIVKAIVPSHLQARIKFIFHRGHCELVPGPGYHSIKDLRQVWRRFPQYSAANTWAIDDTASKYRYQPDNLILLSEFKATDRDDTELERLKREIEAKDHL